MTRDTARRYLNVVAVGLAAVPIGFGTVRAITTGTDFRYLVTAVASLAAAAAVFRGAASRVASRWLLSSLALAVSIGAGGVVASWQGATSVPAVALVVVGFGLCAAGSGILGLFSKRAA